MPIDPAKCFDEGLKSDFWAVRGKAIHAFANLEFNLCTLMGTLLATRYDFADIVYYRIVGSQKRSEVLKDLLKRQLHGKYDTFEPFIDSFFVRLTKADSVRNRIVHWNTVMLMTEPTEAAPDSKFVGFELWKTDNTLPLGPPSHDPPKDNKKPVTQKVMEDFIKECALLSYHLHYLEFFLKNDDFDPAHKQTWQGIFSSPIPAQLPSSHPIHQILQEPERLLRSSIRATFAPDSSGKPHGKKGK